MPDLFDGAAAARRKTAGPLPDRIRPQSFAEFLGQQALVGADAPLRRLIQEDQVPNLIFWGPPGCGKTTLAKLIAAHTHAEFVELSAVMSGVQDIRNVVKDAEATEKYHGRRTILFIDEIHRFNKAQQDALLPHVERGTVTLIGATTENPSFEVITPLLSRCKVFVLEKLSIQEVEVLLARALEDRTRGLGAKCVAADPGVLTDLASMADGDARHALVALELAVKSASVGSDGVIRLTRDHVGRALQRTHLAYDKGGEEHYNIISALHKSMRGSDPDAALYWLGRMLEAGGDPLYVARRLIRFASEDVGLADPQALPQAVAAAQAVHQIGMPECAVNLAQAVVYLSLAKKSNALYRAYGQVARDLRTLPNAPVPLHLRNAPTDLMKSLGYGKGYVYTPDDPTAPQSFLPEALVGKVYWSPEPGILGTWGASSTQNPKKKQAPRPNDASPG